MAKNFDEKYSQLFPKEITSFVSLAPIDFSFKGALTMLIEGYAVSIYI